MNPLTTSTTAKRLKYIMDSRNLKQIDILRTAIPYAEEYNVKMNRSDISQYVSGKVNPGQDKLAVLAKALGVNPVWLMGVDVPMHEKNVTPTSLYPAMLPITLQKNDVTRIPVVGSVIAGIPTEAVQDIVDWEELPTATAIRGDYIGLRIKGHSMEPRICEGDTVIIRRQETIENGELAVVFVNGDEATLKKVKLTDNGIMLIAFNPVVYEPRFYSARDIETLPIKIYGKVVELRGKF